MLFQNTYRIENKLSPDNYIRLFYHEHEQEFQNGSLTGTFFTMIHKRIALRSTGRSGRVATACLETGRMAGFRRGNGISSGTTFFSSTRGFKKLNIFLNPQNNVFLFLSVLSLEERLSHAGLPKGQGSLSSKSLISLFKHRRGDVDSGPSVRLAPCCFYYGLNGRPEHQTGTK